MLLIKLDTVLGRNPFVRSGLHAHEIPFCSYYWAQVTLEDYPGRCPHCGEILENRLLVPWLPVAPPFQMKVEIDDADGRLMQDVKLGPSASADRTVAPVFQEKDRRDSDKSQHRYRKKIVKPTAS
jgi:hypothetical protein